VLNRPSLKAVIDRIASGITKGIAKGITNAGPRKSAARRFCVQIVFCAFLLPIGS